MVMLASDTCFSTPGYDGSGGGGVQGVLLHLTSAYPVCFASRLKQGNGTNRARYISSEMS